MKNLSDYTKKETSKVLKKYKAFFAFSNEQLKEGIKKNKLENVKLANLGGGTILPAENANYFSLALSEVFQKGREADLKENGKEKIIKRELINFESYYSGEIDDAVEALKEYNFNREEIYEIFKTELPKQEL